ncbi:tRNA (cytidine(34)-2'-O)-methyltransferase [Collinsella sp. An307]|uniref:tRNA (cytidine(34)-2'-O)-methyltransferase n=1 Tax=Collinsella sp. An307 TaxID=1965630 RepID=UPI000B391A0F|nr:tRNA (cytidine(34)-2'-O)-methyltransferase [Collinsella sp. An307]OUO21284.1 rRNA methyltransferase [Collinsella sp. An307]
MFNLVLVEPEIPANTGNIGRTCVVTGTRLHLVEPLGFSLDDRALKRAGLGYWENLDVHVWGSWEEFLRGEGLDTPAGAKRLHFLTKKARRIYSDATYRDGDYLVLGKESAGLSEELLAAYAERCERIPMLPDGASLANAESWKHPADEDLDHAALRQQDICGNFVDPNDWRISALNLSNAAAIVLYEALRQTEFAGIEG